MRIERFLVVLACAALACNKGDHGKAPDKKTDAKATVPTILPINESPPADEAKFRGQPVSHWVGRLSDADEGTQLEAVDALASLAVTSPAAVAALRKAVGKYPTKVSVRAAAVIVRYGHEREAFPMLVQGLKDDGLFIDAAVGLERMGPRALPTAPMLADALGKSNTERAVAARMALESMGEAALPTFKAILERGISIELETVEVLQLVQHLGVKGVPAKSAVVGCVADMAAFRKARTIQGRRFGLEVGISTAMNALAGMGATKELTDLAKHEDDEVASGARNALDSISKKAK